MIFFKLPFQDKIYTTDQNSRISKIGFLSFDENDQIEFSGNIVEISKTDFTVQISSVILTKSNETFVAENQSEYMGKLKNVMNFLQENQLKKLVISRRKIVGFDEIDWAESFLNLCANYPNAFVYFFELDGICWMGAFSEILGKFNKKTSEFQTMSLAGTLPIDENWTTKEIEEQKPVSDYIEMILNTFSNQVEASETYDHVSGNIKHLRTDFKAKINEADLENLISELHPTPAVCGIPKELCKKAILDFEKYPREFYAGFSKIETEDSIEFFVNLRCGKFFKKEAHLFVGGGITKDSKPEQEWQETELKSEALLKNLVIEKTS